MSSLFYCLALFLVDNMELFKKCQRVFWHYLGSVKRTKVEGEAADHHRPRSAVAFGVAAVES